MSDKQQTNVRQIADNCLLKVGHVVSMMERVTIRLPTQQVAMLEKLVEAGEFPTVSEAVRYSVRELIGKHANRVIRDSEQISFEM
jgi:metal-responsive CopG/Arc/MetJ family transcriptional regulator